MQVINWACCPRVAQQSVTRAFIEQLARERLAPSTVENYSRDLEDFFTAFATEPFADLLEADESHLAHFVDWLHERRPQRGRRRRPASDGPCARLAPATIRRHICTVRVFYAWCIRLRHRRDPLNPVRAGIRGREQGLAPRPLAVPWIPDERAWAAILRHVLTELSTRDQALVLVAHDGALRRDEIVHLRVDDIDRRTHTIAIRAAITKNHVPGTVVLSNRAFATLSAYLAGDRAALVRYYGADPQGPIFLSDSRRNPGHPISKWTVNDIFDRIRAALDLPRLTPHTMRHLMLTELKRHGMDLLDVGRYARHRSLASTEIYLQTDLSDLARQVIRAHERIAARASAGDEGWHGGA